MPQQWSGEMFSSRGVLLRLCIITVNYFIVSVLSQHTWTPDSSEGSVQCFVSSESGRLRCLLGENPDLDPHSHPRIYWANMIGIGSAKTGTTSLVSLIGKHLDAVVADVKRVHMGYGAEVNYFNTDTSEMESGYHRYALYFAPHDEQPVVVIAEKTPFYSSDPLAAFHARMFLKNPTSSAKLIYTYRDPLEREMSLYLYREWATRTKASFMEWVEPRVEGFKTWMQCRNESFASFLVPNLNGEKNFVTLQDLYRDTHFSWQSSYEIEVRLFEKCGLGNPTGTVPFYMYSDYFYENLLGWNLRRWYHAFRTPGGGLPPPIMCIENSDQLFHGRRVQDEITEFLGLDPSRWGQHGEELLPADSIEKARGERGTYSSTYERLMRSQEALNEESVHSVADAIALINNTLNAYVSEEDQHFLKSFCGIQ